jgi:LytS/YehU family sensor histidine kinase
MARQLVSKLSSILRKLLREQEGFIPLREELEFVDSYLDIESVRFGSGKLIVQKELEPEALETFIPSMIVQPLVENAVKHGVSQRLQGGRIIIRARRSNAVAVIEIEDNGRGLPMIAEHEDGLGIGLTNVNERLKVIYGDKCQLRISSMSGRGTLARLEIPEVDITNLQTSGS